METKKHFKQNIRAEKKFQEKKLETRKKIWRAQKISRNFFCVIKKIFIRKKSKGIQKKFVEKFLKKKTENFAEKNFREKNL